MSAPGGVRRAATLAALLLAGAVAAADRPAVPAQMLERARQEVELSLGVKRGQLDVDQPLRAQGADELDIVEAVMLLEELFGVEIPDERIDDLGPDWDSKLTVRHLMEIVVAEQARKKKG